MRTCAHKYAHACANVHYKKMHYHKQQPLGAHLLNVCCTSHVPGCAFTRQACLCLGCIAWKQLRVFFLLLFAPQHLRSVLFVMLACTLRNIFCKWCHYVYHVIGLNLFIILSISPSFPYSFPPFCV